MCSGGRVSSEMHFEKLKYGPENDGSDRRIEKWYRKRRDFPIRMIFLTP